MRVYEKIRPFPFVNSLKVGSTASQIFPPRRVTKIFVPLLS